MDSSSLKISASLDMQFVRSSFPGLESKWALMDNAGGSQALGSVAEKITEHLLYRNVQIGGTYERSLKAAESLYEGRKAVMDLVNAERPEEIVFAPTSTVALQNLARAMSGSFSEGDEIVVTNFDHESNIGPWVGLERFGARLKWWSLDKEVFEPDLNQLEDLIGPRTRMVCVTHVSNILGTVNPIREIAALAHSKGALVCVDSVAYAPHRAIDVRRLGVDFLVFSAYKTYGPHISAMYGRYDQLLELDNLYHYFYGKDKVPAKLEPGNANYELAYSLTAVRDYLAGLGSQSLPDTASTRDKIEAAFDSITEHECALGEKLLLYLRSRNDVKIIGRQRGDDPDSVPTISFTVDGRDPAEIARMLERFNIAARFGDFHARRLIEHLGLAESNGVIRISLVHYNTPEEVDRLITALEEIV
jgi:cysteine desulfurase family protein (TIGR01976 family)